MDSVRIGLHIISRPLPAPIAQQTMTPPPSAVEAPSVASPNAAGQPALGAWHPLAQALGLRLEEDAWGLQARSAAAAAPQLAAGFAAPLPDLGLLAVTGADALGFLHGQLTNDVEHLADAEARWYGYCTAKGRLLSTFLGWREDEGVALTVARPMAETVRKRLAMFVLRAKAKVSDASDSRLLFGVGGSGAPEALRGLGLEAPGPMAVSRARGASVVGLPAVAVAGRACGRWLLSVPAADAPDAWRALGALAPVSSETWRWTEVLAGVPRIVAATAEHFVPQMLNLDLSGGVSFTKGCYPGQEIVARTHYLGKQRRRMFVGHLMGAAPGPGSDVLDAQRAPVGRVVLAAPSPVGGADLLFEAQIAALAEGPLSVDGTRIVPGELPYALPQ
ncbi:MAG TPA: folate-binding protein [Quisquiliibacterium sp.]|nr:folate-binding protein [Quisquiliibacterium sp.]